MKHHNLIRRLLHSMTVLQWTEVLLIVLISVYFAFTDCTHSWWYLLIDSLATICGVFCVVLCVAGKRCQYWWGFVNIAAYSVIACLNRYYGEVMLNALYYLPLQFIGLYTWKKHYNEEQQHVRTRRMTLRQIILWTSCCIAAVVVYKFILDAMNGQATLLDSISTVFSVLANALMILRYREQWLLWIIVDAVTVVMWLIAKDFLMTAMWGIFLFNAFYGWVEWSKNKYE